MVRSSIIQHAMLRGGTIDNCINDTNTVAVVICYFIKTNMKLPIVVLVLCYVNSIYCARILAVFPMCAHSHFTLGFRLVQRLADKGHNVTFINAFPQKIPIKNLREISVEENCGALQGNFS